MSGEDVTVELAEDLARQEAAEEAAARAVGGAGASGHAAETTEVGAVALNPGPPRRARRNVVGPFSLRQVTLAISAVLISAIVFTVATVPITQIVPNLPVADPTAFLIGEPVPGLALGDLAPELTIDGAQGRVELTDLDGRPIRLEDLRGQAVWINFWASWCPPCQYETPTIRSLEQRYRDRGLAVVAIQVQETVESGRNYAARYDLDYTIGADVTGEFFHLYRVFALPTQFFIDPDGRIREIVNGPLSDARATEIIESILPQAGSSTPPETRAPAASPAGPSSG